MFSQYDKDFSRNMYLNALAEVKNALEATASLATRFTAGLLSDVRNDKKVDTYNLGLFWRNIFEILLKRQQTRGKAEASADLCYDLFCLLFCLPPDCTLALRETQALFSSEVAKIETPNQTAGQSFNHFFQNHLLPAYDYVLKIIQQVEGTDRKRRIKAFFTALNPTDPSGVYVLRRQAYLSDSSKEAETNIEKAVAKDFEALRLEISNSIEMPMHSWWLKRLQDDGYIMFESINPNREIEATSSSLANEVKVFYQVGKFKQSTNDPKLIAELVSICFLKRLLYFVLRQADREQFRMFLAQFRPLKAQSLFIDELPYLSFANTFIESGMSQNGLTGSLAHRRNLLGNSCAFEEEVVVYDKSGNICIYIPATCPFQLPSELDLLFNHFSEPIDQWRELPEAIRGTDTQRTNRVTNPLIRSDFFSSSALDFLNNLITILNLFRDTDSTLLVNNLVAPFEQSRYRNNYNQFYFSIIDIAFGFLREK
jgi:hypothetical protein